MRFNKPLTAGLILATLAAVAQGGVIQRPKEILSDLSQKDTIGSCDHGRIRPGDVVNSCDPIGKRAPPRITRPGRDGDGSSQDGSGAQTGGGAQEGGGSQTGGNRQDGDNTPAAPPAANPAPQAPAAPAVLAAYADIPPNFNNINRVPGQTVLPNEIPGHTGLSTNADDAPRRLSFQRFVNWDIQSSSLVARDSHYLFYVGDKAKDVRLDFKREFNEGGHREGLDPNDKNRIVDNTDIYTGITMGPDKVPSVPNKGDDIWLSMLESYGTAKRAAGRGGIVRVIVDEKPGTNTPNRDRLNEEGSFFYNFELATLTAPGSRIQSIQAYGAKTVNGVRSFTPPTEIWRAGSPQMGKQPDWIAGTVPKEQRTGVPEEDDLIDLDFRKKI